ncbi:MAG: hypothetical protein ACK5HR_06975 [Mycoplasmatales bacterium]
MDLSKIKKSDIKNASSKVKITYKNLEEYDKGDYKVDKEWRLKQLKEMKKNETINKWFNA